jgi:hypothetical protein
LYADIGLYFYVIAKGGFFSESVIRFSNLLISKIENIPKNYPELGI